LLPILVYLVLEMKSSIFQFVVFEVQLVPLFIQAGTDTFRQVYTFR